MRLPTSLSVVIFCLLSSTTTLAVTSFDCKPTIPSNDRSESSRHFDLTALDGVRSSIKETDTPPTKSEAKVKMSLCGDDGIGNDDTLAEEDQCPPDTKVCLTLSNHKPSSAEADRVVAVIPIWPADLSSDDIKVSSLEKEDGLEIYISGADYAGTPQSLSLRILCSPTSTDDSPTLESYTNGLLSLQWSTPAGCARGIEGDDDNDDNDDVPDTPGEKRKGRGFWGFIGLFFWLGVAGLIAYFAIGMYYNYTTYGARGKDLLPHRDFWLELPANLGDLFSHLLAGLRGRHGGSGSANRGGYTAI